MTALPVRANSRLSDLGDAKIRQAGLVLVIEHDIRRLQVTMDDTLFMGFIQRRGQTRDDSDGLFDR